MIDLHSHILPGIDDGAESESVSLAMLKSASDAGITGIAATPHNQVFDAEYCKLFEYWRTQAKKFNIELFCGTEYDYCLLCDGLRKDSGFPMIPINQGRYVLVDFASPLIPLNWENLPIGSFDGHLRRIIVAHPERLFYDALKASQTFYDGGAVIQINAASILGRYGHRVRKQALAVLDAGLCCLIAGDAHRASRTGVIAEAAAALLPVYGRERVKLWTYTNPMHIINSEPVEWVPPRVKAWRVAMRRIKKGLSYIACGR